jgi:hypothetical protein
LYSLRSDAKFPALMQENLSIHVKKGAEKNFFPCQCKMKEIGNDQQLVSVGYREYDSQPLAVAVGRGDDVESAVKMVYDTVKGISMKGLFNRPQSDFLGDDYTSSIPNRMKFLEEKRLI